MKNILLLVFILLNSLTVFAEEPVGKLYKGTINQKPVTLYLKQEPNLCGGTDLVYEGIYQYGSGKNWIELTISANGKGNFCMTEHRFTGVLILQKTGSNLRGTWISPDGKTQFKVSLNLQPLTIKQKQAMDVNLDRTHYENDDC